MSTHPGDHNGLDRREFLRRAGMAGIAMPTLAAILAACQDSSTNSASSSGGANPYGTGGVAGAPYPLPRSDAPVTWNIPEDNQPIASNLPPETNATLKIFNWGYYLKPAIMKQFEQDHGCKVELTTYSGMADATAKIRAGEVDFDLFFGITTDYVGRLIAGKYLQPLNFDYLPNFATNIWDQFKSPFYDVNSQYTVPYNVTTTGIFWRNDMITDDIAGMENPYDIFWSDSAPVNKTHFLGNSRDPLSMAMMRRKITDINTGDPAVIQQAHDDLLPVVERVNPKWENDDYTELPQGQAYLHQSWSGNAMDAPIFYLTPGQSPDIFSYVWPPAVNPDIPGVVGNDVNAIFRTGKNPVLAHMFLNTVLDPDVAYDQFTTYTGYQPPLKPIVAEKVVSDGIIPQSLAGAIVKEEDFQKGLQLFELSPTDDAVWQTAYQSLKAGQ